MRCPLVTAGLGCGQKLNRSFPAGQGWGVNQAIWEGSPVFHRVKHPVLATFINYPYDSVPMDDFTDSNFPKVI